MENEEIENVNSQNDTEETVNSNEDSTESQGEVDIDAEVKKATATLYTRMKQAEADAKEAKAKLASFQTSGSAPKGDLSSTDMYALLEAKVLQDDIPEVQDYAKLKGVSVSEALKSSFVKTLLSDKAEMRNVAQASNTGNVRRGTKQVTDDQILQNVKKGILPETDEDMMRYVQARKKR